MSVLIERAYGTTTTVTCHHGHTRVFRGRHQRERCDEWLDAHAHSPTEGENP